MPSPHIAASLVACLDTLLATMKQQHTRASIALVLADDAGLADSTSWHLTIDSQGMLSIPALGVELSSPSKPRSAHGPGPKQTRPRASAAADGDCSQLAEPTS